MGSPRSREAAGGLPSAGVLGLDLHGGWHEYAHRVQGCDDHLWRELVQVAALMHGRIHHMVDQMARHTTSSPPGPQDRSMNTLIILNDPPYGTERSYNGLRLGGALAKREGEQVRVFLMGDAASGAKAGQSPPQGFYSIERMIRVITLKGGEVAACSTCMDARGLKDEELSEGTRRGSLEELADWTQWADRVLVF